MHSIRSVALISVLVLGAHVWGQSDTASVAGVITDATGAVVPQVTVSVRHISTNLTNRTKTDSAGYYSVAPLRVGEYVITAEAEGFKKAVRPGIVLEVGLKPRVDFVLEVGEVTQEVTVEAAALAVQTESGSTGSVIENKQIVNLPLAQRNWDDLLGLVAGVLTDRYTEEIGGTSLGLTGRAVAHGVRSLQNNFVLDGVDNNVLSTNYQESSAQVVRTSVDSIQEFKATTAPYSAENGRSPGALVSVVTKGGTNGFHGTLYEYLRNRVFDANNFFSNRAGAEKGANVQNQFGGNLGGPIVRDRAFFFFDYEGTRTRKGVNRIATVPLANEKAGDFSPSAAAAARAKYATLRDPLSSDPFANNIVPAARFDPVATTILSYFPEPNQFPAGALNTTNYFRVPSITDDTDRYSMRGDYRPGDNDDLFVRYSYSDRFRHIPGNFGGIADGTTTSSWGRQYLKAHSAVLGWTRTLSPYAVNEFRLGWSRGNSESVQDPFGLNTLADLGIRGVPDNPIYSGGIPRTNFDAGGGVPSTVIGSPNFLPKWQKTNQFQWVDTLSLTVDKHQIKMGGDVRAPMRNIYLDVPGLRGELRSSGQFTGISYADFLLGYISRAQLSNLAITDQRLHMYSFYFQDDWKVTPRLTLNAGFRYDFGTWPIEGANNMANVDPVTGEFVLAKDGSLEDRTTIRPDRNNFAPRFGFAYQLTSNTVVRGGYGRFYLMFDRYGSEDQLSLNPPFLINNNTLVPGGERVNPLFFLRDGFPAEFLDPNALDLRRLTLRAVNAESVTPSYDHWSFGLQRQFPGGILATLDYVGTKGTHLSSARNINAPSFTTGQVPFPHLGTVSYRDNNMHSSYNGMELTAERRFGSGLSFRAAYTLSKSLDYNGEPFYAGTSGNSQDARNVMAHRGLSDWDSTHRVAFSAVYELPFGAGRRFAREGVLAHVLGGWQLSGLFSRRSGLPFTVLASSNNRFLGSGHSAYPDRIGNGTLSQSERTVDRWFDPEAFVVPTPFHPGNSGRNILRGPVLTSLDMALARNFSISEGAQLQFRAEAFNLPNTPQFGRPFGDRSSPAAGLIFALAGDPRVMQFALRLTF